VLFIQIKSEMFQISFMSILFLFLLSLFFIIHAIEILNIVILNNCFSFTQLLFMYE